MILTGPEIKRQVLAGRVHIKPFIDEHINPNSYNYRLGDELFEITDAVIDSKAPVTHRRIHLTDRGYVLLPNRLYLAATAEEIGSDYYVTSLIGRSSVGRLGLFLQVTADLGHLGAKHAWTLELKVVQPLRVYPGMKIGQVSFWCPEGDTNLRYDGNYARHSRPHCSEIHKELKTV